MQMKTSAMLRQMNYLSGELDGVYHEAAWRLGLSDSACRILYALYDNDGRCLLSELVRCCGLSKQTVNSALRKLESEGILQLSPAGARTKVVCLTDEGRAFSEKTVQRLIGLENELFSAWSPEDVLQYTALMERHLNDLRARVEEL